MSLLTDCDFGGSNLSACHKDEHHRRALLAKTLPGRQRARELGRLGGRPKKLTLEEIAQLKKLYDNKANSVDTICQYFHVSRPTFYKYLHDRHHTKALKK